MNKYKCEKCGVEYLKNGLGYSIDDYHYIVCQSCQDLFYEKLEVFVTQFIQPERSKREESFSNDWNIQPYKWEKICGALNSMET